VTYLLVATSLADLAVPVVVTHRGPKRSRVIMQRALRLPGRRYHTLAGQSAYVPTESLHTPNGDRMHIVSYQPVERGFGVRSLRRNGVL
jgi:hypothetical protein